MAVCGHVVPAAFADCVDNEKYLVLQIDSHSSFEESENEHIVNTPAVTHSLLNAELNNVLS